MKFGIAPVVLLVALTFLYAAHPPQNGKNAAFLKMALVNIKSVYSDGPDAAKNRANIDANLKRHFYFIDKLAARTPLPSGERGRGEGGADFIGFPELSVNGYHFSKTMTWLKIDGPEIESLQKKAIEKGIYISVGVALEDADGKRWNVQIVIDPQRRIIGMHRKIWLTAEKAFVQAGADHKVFDVKGMKMGIAICADGSDKKSCKRWRRTALKSSTARTPTPRGARSPAGTCSARNGPARTAGSWS